MSSSRVRKPSERMREIAEAHRRHASPPTASTSKPKASSSSKPKAKPKKARSASPGTVAVDSYLNFDEDVTGMDDGTVPGQLFCICLSTDDTTPMIQCEGCENWFHFACIGLDHRSAADIVAYYCDICTEAGTGATVRKSDPPTQRGLEPDFEPSGSGGEDDLKTDRKRGKHRTAFADSDGEGRIDEDARPRPTFSSKRASASKLTSAAAKRRKKARPEGLSDEDDDESDEDYMGGEALLPEEREEQRERKRASGSSSKKRSEPRERKPNGKSSVDASLQRAQTRALCVDNLRKALEPLLAKSRDIDAHDFAEEVEQVLFKEHAEPEPNGQRAPKQKYMAKFRALSYNLKSNEPFRQRIARKELDAQEVARMAPEDLLSAEQRAMADAVREQSMRASVKQADDAPTARVTHKGMEVIDTPDASISLGGGREMPPPISIPRRDSMATGQQSPPPPTPGRYDSSADDMQVDRSPIISQSPRTAHSPSIPQSPTTSDRGGSARPETRRSVSINLDSVWGAASAPVGNMADATTGETDDFNPVTSTHDDDRELDAILHGEGPTPAAPVASSSKYSVPITPNPELTELAPVWFGPVQMPDEATFPAVAVQVAGRPLGEAAETWQQILPVRLDMAGRLPIKTASDYLVQNTFTATRELIVLALLPDQSGPTPEDPHKPTAEAAMQANEHLINYFAKKQRYGVCPPPRHLRFVRDTYIVPLCRNDPMPEFIDLLDSHQLGEQRPRDRDLLLAVMVLQRGLVPLAVAEESPAPPLQVGAPVSVAAPSSALTPEMAAALAALAGGAPASSNGSAPPSQDALTGLLSSFGGSPPPPVPPAPTGPPMNPERAALLARQSGGYPY